MNLNLFISESDEKTFQKFKDQLMKLVEDDLQLIAWFAYCLDLLFIDKSFEEMRDYIATVSDKELEEYLVKVENPEIKEMDNPGIEPDVIYDLYNYSNGNREYIGSLGIDNQVKEFTEAQKINRTQFTMCSLIFREGRKGGPLNKKNYNNLRPVSEIWIYPSPAGLRKNIIDIDITKLPQERKRIKKDKNSYLIQTIKDFHQIKNVVYSFYLGNPLELDNLNEVNNISERKLLFLLRLIDLVFQFWISSEERLKYLNTEYCLRNKITLSEVNTMSELQTIAKMFEKEYEIQDKELKNKDEELKNKDKELKTKDKELETKDQQILKQKQEIELLKKQNQENDKLRNEIDQLKAQLEALKSKYEPVPIN